MCIYIYNEITIYTTKKIRILKNATNKIVSNCSLSYPGVIPPLDIKYNFLMQFELLSCHIVSIAKTSII